MISIFPHQCVLVRLVRRRASLLLTHTTLITQIISYTQLISHLTHTTLITQIISHTSLITQLIPDTHTHTHLQRLS